MANYLRPDVYVEEISSGEKPITSTATSIGAFVGVTARGKVGEAIQVTSWTDFVKKFSKGLSTPFMRSSDLAHAVYGFYQNGGSVCYVVRVGATNMAKAEATFEDLVITAKDEGDWANNKLKVQVEAVEDNFTVSVFFDNILVEVFENVSNNMENPRFFGEIINSQSEFIHIEENQVLVAMDTTPFTKGAYDIATITEAEYLGEKGIKALDVANTVNLVAIPGKTSDTIAKGLVDYTTNRGDCFAIIDAPLSNETDTESLLTFRSKLSGNGAIYTPWGKIADPLSANGALRNCPPCGHIMGVYARTDSNRGVHKEPAGEEATVKGFVDLCARVTPTQIEILNPKAVNCIVAKPNSGIVVWGGRNIGTDSSKPYVSDLRYDIMVKKSLHEGTQWAVFEPNDEALLDRLNSSLTSFLDLQWRNGALLGTAPEQAYYVKCDEELNDTTSRNNGLIIAEIGYCKKKPAEFVVIRIVQKSN